jgi:hypothetical protein
MSPKPALSREDWAERAAAKIALAQQTLAAQVAAVCSGEDWKRFLDFQARLHSYSPNNVMLIAAQHARAYADGLVSSPEPTYVAGFNTWKALGRSVNKGQHGYAVLAPCRYDRKTATDANGQTRRLARDESPAPDDRVEQQNVLAGFRVEHVFDVSQTSGAELPDAPRPVLLEGEAPPGLAAAVVGLIEARGYRLDTVADAAAIQGANGQTNWASRTVLVRADMSDAAITKTLIHEAAHVLAHEGPPGKFLPRPIKEVEAESVAYVVAAAHGMPTDGYSFPYVAAWAGEAGAAAVRATQGRVAGTARQIIEASPATHTCGGKVPGAEAALAAARARRADLEGRLGAGVEPAQAVAL